MNEIPTVIGFCCREWVISAIHPPGRCGICGQAPSYLRPDPDTMRYEPRESAEQ